MPEIPEPEVRPARCELTELLVDQCAHCRPAPVPEPSEATSYGPWILAVYGGECADCDDQIWPGDAIRSDGEGGWLCETCGDERG